MKTLKKGIVIVLAFVFVLSFGIVASAAALQSKNTGEPEVDRSGHVTRVDIPNGDGTFTTLEGDAAQAWYNEAVAEGEQRKAQESQLKMIGSGDEINADTKGPFHYKYRYLESKHTNDVERTELEKTVTNKLRNTSSSDQSYTLSLNVSQSWTVSPSVSSEYEKAIKAGISGSWGNTYSKSESLSVNVKPGKTLWVTFVPIMDKSEGKAQKYYKARFSGRTVIEKSYNVVTYNPKYLTSKVGPFTFKSVYGVYVWHES